MIKIKNTLIAFLLIGIDSDLYSQDFIGGGFTVSTYFGDISPFSIKQSWASLHPGAGFYFSKQIKKPFYIEFDLEHSTISAADATSNDQPRKVRNLSFSSPITSLAISVGLRVPINKQEKFGFSGGLGGSVFKFNPKANLDGKWYRLQPLSTEGQGLPGGPNHYTLLQWAIPVHGGIFFNLTNKIKAEFVITQYFTNTDYLDDVSGNYYDPDLLILNKGQIAYRLAYRSKEVNPDSHDIPSGSPRGNPKKNDQFVFAKIGITHKMENLIKRKSGLVKCPEFK